MKVTGKTQRSVQFNFRIPPELAKSVRLEAADRGVYPVKVLAERLADSFDRRPWNVPPKTAG